MIKVCRSTNLQKKASRFRENGPNKDYCETRKREGESFWGIQKCKGENGKGAKKKKKERKDQAKGGQGGDFKSPGRREKHLRSHNFLLKKGRRREKKKKLSKEVLPPKKGGKTMSSSLRKKKKKFPADQKGKPAPFLTKERGKETKKEFFVRPANKNSKQRDTEKRTRSFNVRTIVRRKRKSGRPDQKW